MTIVKVGTANPVKVEGVKDAFKRYLKEDVEVISFEVDSGVASQPRNKEVIEGAKNRLKELKKLGEDNWDYLVSCEGGLIDMYGNWVNMQVVIVEAKNGMTGFGCSQGFEVPQEHIEEAINTSIAKVLDKIYDGKGGVRVITRDNFTRKDLIRDATIMALAGVKW